jgi:hypothetical protein
MDVYQKMLDNAIAHRKQMQSILSTQISYYDDLNVEKEAQDIVTRKMNLMRQPGAAVQPVQAAQQDADKKAGEQAAQQADTPAAADAAAPAPAADEKGAGAADSAE